VTIRRGATTWAEAWWAEADLSTGPVAALVPESNMAIKRWPLACWGHVADALDRAGCRTLLVLPPDKSGDAPAAALSRELHGSPLVLRARLDRVAAILARCALVVGVDTGLLHLAAAVGARYVGLFGPTNPLVTGPYARDLGVCLVAPYAKGAACRGCWRQFKYIDDRCAALGDPSCMGHLAPEVVAAAVMRQLELATARTAGAPPPTRTATSTPVSALV
jgi:ADP-heptose:LPS heptosyltransferase